MADMLAIVPSRGRPHNIAALATTWELAHGHADLLVAVDDDDPELPQYVRVLNAHPWIRRHIGPRLRLCGTLNAVATTEATRYRNLAFLGDDHRPAGDWAQRFNRELARLGTGLVYGDDGIQHDKMPTAVAMTSDIVETLGYFCAPALVHLCMDLVWLDLGSAIDRITYLPEVQIPHLHPCARLAPWDDRYAEVNSAEQVASDSAAYFTYRDGGQFQADVAALKALIGSDA